MNLQEILANKELAILKKKSEIQKSDYSKILYDSVSKAYNNNIDKLEVLIYEAIVKKDRNEFMFNQYLKGYVLNHSVGMRYLKLFFCYNNDSPEFSQDKENFDKYYSQILNKDDVQDYFWAIVEAKHIEASAVVKGSNFLTPVLELTIIDENTIKVKCAISPSNVLDSHKDVHIPSLYKKALNENVYNIMLQEHEMELEKVIVDSITGELKVYTQMISVKELMSKFTKKNIEAAQSTSKIEPPVGTHQSNTHLLIF
jgi:hypothetical protein